MAETLHMDPAHPDPHAPADEAQALQARQRRRARHTALLLAVVALALYFGFIAYSVTTGLHGHH